MAAKGKSQGRNKTHGFVFKDSTNISLNNCAATGFDVGVDVHGSRNVTIDKYSSTGCTISLRVTGSDNIVVRDSISLRNDLLQSIRRDSEAGLKEEAIFEKNHDALRAQIPELDSWISRAGGVAGVISAILQAASMIPF